MKDWTKMWLLYEQALLDPEDMRGFVNLELGLPYKEIGGRPDYSQVIELRSGYKSGDIPDGVLFLTAAIDVQRGSEKDLTNPARLEMEICGHGAEFRTWSIMYKEFIGAVDDIDDGAWLLLTEFQQQGGLVFHRDDGTEFSPKLTFIDSGDGETTSAVYEYCQTWKYTYPSKGFNALKKKKGEADDEINPSSHFKKYRRVKLGDGTILYEISTTLYKTAIYKNIVKRHNPTGKQPKGFCEFPKDYPKKYFTQLTSEEKLSGNKGFANYGRRNEALDCRVYNLCAADAFLNETIDLLQQHYKNEGWSAPEWKAIDHVWVLEWLRRSTERVTK
jgi:phage terminase large subunit GpA-like protein